MRYGRLNVLDNVDVVVRAGEILTLIGLNGAGKSTLVRVILDIVTPDSGEVWRAPGLRVGYSPQHLHRDQILPMTVRRFLALGAQESRKKVAAVLEEVGAASIVDFPLAEISGGELQRVLLARALLREPDLLVFDEPLSGVDASGQIELYKLIASIRDRYGCAVILVSHDLHLVMAATDTVVCLNRHVCCSGRPHSVVGHPEFISLFGRHLSETLAVYQHMHDRGHDAPGAPPAADSGAAQDSGGAGLHP